MLSGPEMEVQQADQPKEAPADTAATAPEPLDHTAGEEVGSPGMARRRARRSRLSTSDCRAWIRKEIVEKEAAYVKRLQVT